MKNIDIQLGQLQEQVMEKKRLETILRELHKQQRELQNKLYELGRIRSAENADVEKLEKLTLTSLYYLFTGKKSEMLDKERQEAYMAQLKYDSAKEELEAVAADIQNTKKLLANYADCEQKYVELKAEKKEAIKKSGSHEAEQILEIEEEILTLENRLKEIREAYVVGSEALRIADEIINSLKKAKGLGTWDTFGGGGLITDIAKRSNLNTAERLVGDLQRKLRKYKTELADVTIEANVEVSHGEFLNFADMFFDGLLVDWTVLNQITNSVNQAETTRGKIVSMQYRLDNMTNSIDREIEQKKKMLDSLLVK